MTLKFKESSVKLIQIFGPSFCGSTFMGFILGSLNEVANVGEDHWWWRGKLSCSVCSAKKTICDYINSERRNEILESEDPWYVGISKLYKKDIICSSNKNPSIFNMVGCEGTYQFPILLFRSPEAQLCSMRKYHPCKYENENEYFDFLIKYYSTVLNYLKEMNTNFIVLDFDYFLANKDKCMEMICNSIGIEWDTKAIKYWEYEQHTVGGNHTVYEEFKKNKSIRDIQANHSWRKSRTEKEIASARMHRYNIMYAKLVKMSAKNF